MTEVMEKEAAKTITWQSFSFEEHIRGFVGIPEDCVFTMRAIEKGFFRVTVWRRTPRPDGSKYVKSVLVRVVTSPTDGHVFTDAGTLSLPSPANWKYDEATKKFKYIQPVVNG